MPGTPSGVEIILTDTRHSGNIGAVARLLKNLGLTENLTLVNPTSRIHLEAVRMAAGAEDVIEKAKVGQDLEWGIADCTETFAVTRRPRRVRKDVFTPEEAAIRIAGLEGKIGFVFGSEKFGLSNEQVALCGSIIAIPVSPEWPSYNLSQSVAIVMYQIVRTTLARVKQGKKSRREPADIREKRILYDLMINTIGDAGFFVRGEQKATSSEIENIFERAQLDKKDVRILLGVFKRLNSAVHDQGS